MDRFSENRYWHVDFFDAGTGALMHNDIIASFSELCFLAQGRTFVIRGPATHQEYRDAMETQTA